MSYTDEEIALNAVMERMEKAIDHAESTCKTSTLFEIEDVRAVMDALRRRLPPDAPAFRAHGEAYPKRPKTG